MALVFSPARRAPSIGRVRLLLYKAVLRYDVVVADLAARFVHAEHGACPAAIIWSQWQLFKNTSREQPLCAQFLRDNDQNPTL
jgi:hypothetical protein